jgi:hypothetical protein
MGDPGRPSLVRGNVLLHRATCRDDPDQALADLDAAARVFADAGARVRLGRTVGQRGEVLLRRGDADGAARSFAEALAIGEELDDPSVRSLARCGLADVADCRGDLAGAVNGFRAALADARAAGSAQAEAYCLASLADASLAAGADADALAAARESLAIQGRQVRGLGSDESRTVGDAIPAARSTGLAAARRLGDASAWFDVAETARAAALAENVGGRAAIQSSAAPPELVAESAAAQSELSRASARLAAARAAEDLAAARGAAADEAAARTRSVQSLDRLERRRKLAARLDAPAPPVLADVRRRLGPATALVEYHVGATAAEALVATADAARLVDLGPSDAVAACCADLARADGATAEALAAAAARIVGPLRLAPEVRTLVVVPDGPLATAPLAAIAGGRDVVCVPSAAIWMLLAEDGGRRGEGVLAIGDPDHAGRRLAGLPATRAEAQAVGTTVLLGRDATEAAVRKALDGGARRRAVHFACHGVADPRHPSLAGLALTAEAGDDGMLTAREVLGMAVPADLTFLSACEAGRSGARTGAAAPVLASAFLAAGSPRVVCNVWKVDDEAARAFATAFHQAFRSDGASAASALRAAREAVRADPRFAAPRHWAGWVLWGLAD